MAKINLTTQQHNQENLSVVASLGVLLCMVVAIVGIKLWWFKHRLSFEQSSSTQNSTGSGARPPAIVPRRSKQQKYKKDKRYSQEIYESVEVHGVFRRKPEDDLEFQRPQQLPPIRIRQLSGSTKSLILPPPRTKKRYQVHSTAFEDLQIATPPLTTASSSDLTVIPEINTKITLTFEEFEKQFNLKEIKHEAPQPSPSNNETIEMPVPPLRLNRSSSALTKPDKPLRLLHTSQSITIPEFQRVIEKKPTGYSSPKEDLTKIDDYEPQIFESFGQRRPTGYMKYEEVDNILQDHYERQLNAELDKEDYEFSNNDVCGSSKKETALKALRNERILYNNDSNESFDIQTTKENNFSKKAYESETVDYKEHYDAVIKKLSNYNKKDQGFSKYLSFSKNSERNVGSVFERPHAEHSPNGEREMTGENHPLKDNTKFRKEAASFENVLLTQPQVTEEQVNHTDIKSTSGYTEIFDSLSFQEDFDSQFNSWPQFEEKIETPKVNIRRFHLETPTSSDKSNSIAANGNETGNQTETNQRRAWDYQRHWPETTELKEADKGQESSNNKLYNQMRSFMSSESSETILACSEIQNSDIGNKNNSNINAGRPTGLVRDNEYYVTFSDESDEDSENSLTDKRRNSTNNVRSTVEIVEIETHRVNFPNNEYETEKYTLNQRRPTGFVKSSNNEEAFNNTEIPGDGKDLSETQVKFADSTDYKTNEEIWNTAVKQRRPTGYIKQLNMFDLSDEETNSNKPKTEVPSSSPTVKFSEFNDSFKKYEINTESLLDQRRPTGYVRQAELDQLEKQVSFQINSVDRDTVYKDNNALSERRPTGFIRNEETTKQVNFQLSYNSLEGEHTHFGNDQLKERIPTGYVKQKQLQCLDQPAPIYRPSNDHYKDVDDFDNHLWQEMADDVELDIAKNYEEEFAKIRHWYELNEADFLEQKNSHTTNKQQPLGFGRSIEDDWQNFAKLKSQIIVKPLKSPEEIRITFSEPESAATTSILKEHNSEEDIQEKPRKSKVTFDFKTDERVIPPRKIHNSSEEDSDYDYNDDISDKPPPPLPTIPQPRQRTSNINYNTENTIFSPIVSIPQEISLFGSQISRQNDDIEDSWTAIRQHRNLTEELHNISTESKLSEPDLVFNTPAKPSYRNPMAQLAIQRAKEVRSDMDRFKSRSINNRKAERSKRQQQKIINLNRDAFEGTEA